MRKRASERRVKSTPNRCWCCSSTAAVTRRAARCHSCRSCVCGTHAGPLSAGFVPRLALVPVLSGQRPWGSQPSSAAQHHPCRTHSRRRRSPEPQCDLLASHAALGCADIFMGTHPWSGIKNPRISLTRTQAVLRFCSARDIPTSKVNRGHFPPHAAGLAWPGAAWHFHRFLLLDPFFYSCPMAPTHLSSPQGKTRSGTSLRRLGSKNNPSSPSVLCWECDLPGGRRAVIDAVTAAVSLCCQLGELQQGCPCPNPPALHIFHFPK